MQGLEGSLVGGSSLGPSSLSGSRSLLPKEAKSNLKLLIPRNCVLDVCVSLPEVVLQGGRAFSIWQGGLPVRVVCGEVCMSGKPLKELMGTEIIFLLIWGTTTTVLPTIHIIPLLFKEK